MYSFKMALFARGMVVAEVRPQHMDNLLLEALISVFSFGLELFRF